MAQEDKRLQRRVRSSYLISTVSIAMVLFLLGTVTYLILNALNATNRLRESVAVYVLLAPELTETQTRALQTAIESQEGVREVVFVSKELAAKRFIEESGEDYRTFIDTNPLPDYFEVGFKGRASQKSLIGEFARNVEAMKGVDEVVWQKGVVERMGSNLGELNIVVLLFGGALLFISFFLLRNTVHMTVMAKLRIINTMKLVGANECFIMRPFLGLAALHGVYAGLIAVSMFLLLVIGVGKGLPELALLRGNVVLLSIAGGMVVVGVAISVLFTLVGVSRAVRQPSHKMYI